MQSVYMIGKVAEIRIYSALIDYSSLFEGSNVSNVQYSVTDPGLNSSTINMTGSMSINGNYTTFSASFDSYYGVTDKDNNGIYDFFEIDERFSMGINGYANYNIERLGSFSANLYADIIRPQNSYQFTFNETVTYQTSNIQDITPGDSDYISFDVTGVHALGSLNYDTQNKSYSYSLNYHGTVGSDSGSGTYSVGNDNSVFLSKLSFPSIGKSSYSTNLPALGKKTLFDSLSVPYGDEGSQHVMTIVEGVPYYVVINDYNDDDSDGKPDLIDIPKNYTVTTTSTSNGSVYGAGEYSEGTEVTLQAFPNSGYTFDGWSGDFDSTVNPLSFKLTSNISLSATFGSDLGDDDGDGLTNFDEIIVHGTNHQSSDTDFDGTSDLTEINNGSDPKTYNLYRFINDQYLKNNWILSQWLGYYYETDSEWIYSITLGWLYDTKNSTANSSRWFYEPGLNWLWGGESLGSFLYSETMDRWFYVGLSQIYDYQLKLWKSKNGLIWSGQKNDIRYFSGKFTSNYTSLETDIEIFLEKGLRSESGTAQTFSTDAISFGKNITLLGEITIK